MPSYDQKRKWWVGSVRKKIQGNHLAHLARLQNWTEPDPDTFLYRKSKAGFALKRDATQWETEHWDLIVSTQVSPTIRLTFSQVSTEYLNLSEPRFKGRETLKYKARLIRNFISFCGYDPYLPIQTVTLESYLTNEYKIQGGKKANRSLREFNTIFTWMMNRKYISDNPTTPIEQFEEEEFKKYVPPPEDIKLVIESAWAFEKDLIRTAYHTLARSIELRRLKCSDCDFENRKVWFSTRKRKGGSIDRGSVDMNNSLYEILYRRVRIANSEYIFPSEQSGRLSKSTLDNIMPRIIKKLNKNRKADERIKSFGFQAIRHHVAAHLYLNCGYSVAEMQRILRHKRASTTDVYLKSIVDMNTGRGLNALDDFESKEQDIKPEEKRVIGYPDRL
jgi:integrase